MRAPNGQSCTLGNGLEYSLVMAGDIVWRCHSHFEKSVKTGVPVRFQFSDDEVNIISSFYKDGTDMERLRRFLNCVILMQKKMPFEVQSLIHLVGTEMYSCKMVSELPVFD